MTEDFTLQNDSSTKTILLSVQHCNFSAHLHVFFSRALLLTQIANI